MSETRLMLEKICALITFVLLMGALIVVPVLIVNSFLDIHDRRPCRDTVLGVGWTGGCDHRLHRLHIVGGRAMCSCEPAQPKREMEVG